MILTMQQVEYLKRCSFQYQTSGLFQQANFDLDAYVRTFVIKEFQEALHLSRDEELLDAGDLVREVTELEEAQRWSIWTYKWQPEYRAYIEPMKEHWMLKELVPNLKILIEPPRFLPGITSKDYVDPSIQVVSLSGWNTDEGAWHYAA